MAKKPQDSAVARTARTRPAGLDRFAVPEPQAGAGQAECALNGIGERAGRRARRQSSKRAGVGRMLRQPGGQGSRAPRRRAQRSPAAHRN